MVIYGAFKYCWSKIIVFIGVTCHCHYLQTKAVYNIVAIDGVVKDTSFIVQLTQIIVAHHFGGSYDTNQNIVHTSMKRINSVQYTV